VMKNNSILKVFLISISATCAATTTFPKAEILKQYLTAQGFEVFALHTTIVERIAEKEKSTLDVDAVVKDTIQDFFDRHIVVPTWKNAIRELSYDLAQVIKALRSTSKL